MNFIIIIILSRTIVFLLLISFLNCIEIYMHMMFSDVFLPAHVIKCCQLLSTACRDWTVCLTRHLRAYLVLIKKSERRLFAWKSRRYKWKKTNVSMAILYRIYNTIIKKRRFVTIEFLWHRNKGSYFPKSRKSIAQYKRKSLVRTWAIILHVKTTFLQYGPIRLGLSVFWWSL